jgi:hypothetical protein
VDKEVVAQRPGGRQLLIEPVDAFSYRIKFEGGGELPAKLGGVYSHARAVQAVEEYIRNQ